MTQKTEELNSDGTFRNLELEQRYQQYVQRKQRKGQQPRVRADWNAASDYWTQDSPIARGNKFNETANQNYDYYEVHLDNGKRLDAYEPGEAIISRKATDFDKIQSDTFREYLKEMKDKYMPGTTKIRSNKYPRLDGQPLDGKLVLEVPDSNLNSATKDAFEQIAKSEGIEIRYTSEE
ncbi:hypothetical protein [Scytonema sp. NUACC26]|uniref:hypothetical protein n=1 Tax=Scytonema sp. NUACC26 TaxID=3140176 RepID=UPI0038B23B59